MKKIVPLAAACVLVASSGISMAVASATSAAVVTENQVLSVSRSGLTDPSIPALPNAHCGLGETALHPSAAGRTADGGYVYQYVIAGRVNRVLVPPRSFSPATASAATLAEYGFPPRPSDSAGKQRWSNKWAANFKGVPLPQLCSSNRSNRPASQASSSAQPGTPTGDTASSSNWAGIVGYWASKFVAVQGDWVQSHVHDCGCGTTDTDESSWSGIGGWGGSQSLIQEGTSMQGTGSMFAWYEYLHACSTSGCNPPELIMRSVPVSGGMQVHTYTAYQTSNSQANFLVCANGTCQSIVATLDSSYYQGLYAENIDERPSYGCGTNCSYYKPLTNFLYNDWTNSEAEATSGTWYSLENIPAWGVTMVNTSGQTLVTPTAFGSTTMTDTWYRAQ